jgi:hypothetical protein
MGRYSFSVWLFHPQHLTGFPGAQQDAEKVRQLRFQSLGLLTYYEYAPGRSLPAALLGGLFDHLVLCCH